MFGQVRAEFKLNAFFAMLWLFGKRNLTYIERSQWRPSLNYLLSDPYTIYSLSMFCCSLSIRAKWSVGFDVAAVMWQSMAVYSIFVFYMRPVDVTVAGHCCPCVPCDLIYATNLVASIRVVLLHRVSYVSLDPIYGFNTQKTLFVDAIRIQIWKWFNWIGMDRCVVMSVLLTLSTCWQNRWTMDRCNVILGPMVSCRAFVCDSSNW